MIVLCRPGSRIRCPGTFFSILLYGGIGRYWDLLLMAINFWLLFFPCRVLVVQIRNIFYAYAVGRMFMPHAEIEKDVERMKVYEAINPLVAAVALDIVIIVVSPPRATAYSPW